MSAGSRIQNKVLRGLQKAGRRTGTGPLICTIKRPANGQETPWDTNPAGDPAFYEVTAVQGSKEIKDASGTLIGHTMTTLTIDATGVIPLKSDLIAVGVAKADAGADTAYHEVADINTLAPGGVAILFEVTIAD